MACKGICFRLSGKKPRSSEYFKTHVWCAICQVWIPNEITIKIGVKSTLRCPCCHKPVRTRSRYCNSFKEKVIGLKRV